MSEYEWVLLDAQIVERNFLQRERLKNTIIKVTQMR